MKQLMLAAAIVSLPLSAGTVLFSGFLDPNNANDIAMTTVTLAATGSIDLQSYSYGGGTDLLNNVFAAGGFDPIVSIYAGTDPTALLVDFNDDGTCPPGNTLTVSGNVNCFDSTLNVSGLAAGTYTIVVTNFGNGPFASEFDPPIFFNTLGDGFLGIADYLDPSDLQTPVTNFYAVDITTSGIVNPPPPDAPEPASLALVAMGVAALIWKAKRAS